METETFLCCGEQSGCFLECKIYRAEQGLLSVHFIHNPNGAGNRPYLQLVGNIEKKERVMFFPALKSYCYLGNLPMLTHSHAVIHLLMSKVLLRGFTIMFGCVRLNSLYKALGNV